MGSEIASGQVCGARSDLGLCNNSNKDLQSCQEMTVCAQVSGLPWDQ